MKRATEDLRLLSTSANHAAAALQSVKAFLASDHAATQEKVDRLVSFLADDLDDLDNVGSQQILLSQEHMTDPVAQELQDTKDQQEALLKRLGGDSQLLAQEQRGASVGASVLDDEQRQQQEKVDQLVGALAGTSDAASAVSDESLLAVERRMRADENPDDEVVDQIIGALSNADDTTAEGALLTSEFSGEVGGGVDQLLATDSAPETIDQIIDTLASTYDGTDEGALLTSEFNGEVGGDADQLLLAMDTASAGEKVAQLVAFLADKHHHPKNKKDGSGFGQPRDATVPKALAFEAVSSVSSSQQQETLPHMMFGGAFLLVAAVLLTVMTKRTRASKPHTNKEDAYAYYLHE
jgi:hypothetical protein